VLKIFALSFSDSIVIGMIVGEVIPATLDITTGARLDFSSLISKGNINDSSSKSTEKSIPGQ
jgi:hypothetical protein